MKWFVNLTKETSGTKELGIHIQKQIDSLLDDMRNAKMSIKQLYSGNEWQDSDLSTLKSDIDKIKTANAMRDLQLLDLITEVSNLKKQKIAKIAKKKIRRALTYSVSYYDAPYAIAKDLSKSMKQEDIANELNQKGFITPTHSAFTQKSVSKMLNNEWLKARFEAKYGKSAKSNQNQVPFLDGIVKTQNKP